MAYKFAWLFCIQSMNYQTFEPDRELETLVKCYWTLESPEEKETQKQTIVPDGCMEMIFHYGDAYIQHMANGSRLVQPKSFVIGQLTRPLEIEPTGSTGIFSIRFHPGGFEPFASLPIKEMENTAVPLVKLYGKDGQEIEEKILEAESSRERINLIEDFLLSRLAVSQRLDSIVKSTVETILTANGQLSVEEISRQTKINRRQLERRFSAAIGLSPKQLSKTIRLQSTLKILLNKKFTSLTTLAYHGEYYDQAHFIKDFKELTGFTPKEFYGSKLKMTSLFIAD